MIVLAKKINNWKKCEKTSQKITDLKYMYLKQLEQDVVFCCLFADLRSECKF